LGASGGDRRTGASWEDGAGPQRSGERVPPPPAAGGLCPTTFAGGGEGAWWRRGRRRVPPESPRKETTRGRAFFSIFQYWTALLSFLFNMHMLPFYSGAFVTSCREAYFKQWFRNKPVPRTVAILHPRCKNKNAIEVLCPTISPKNKSEVV
jgi:hypothetical protein